MTTPTETKTTRNRLRIDFLFLDLETCTRCRGTDRNLDAALDAVRSVLAMAGAEVDVNRIHVESAAQARELRLESSPTIRVNGRDVALELRESSCDSEACTDDCGEPIACRVWVYRDEEYDEPPVAMILDALLREVYGGTAADREADVESYDLPDNLARFFAAEEAANAEARAAAAEPAQARCCEPFEQGSCCAPEDKAECCGASAGEGCGCR